MALRIEILNDKQAQAHEALNHFLKENATIFQQLEFLRAVGNDLHVAVAFEEDDIVGALPQLTTKKYGLRASHIPPYGYTYGPVLIPKRVKDEGAVVSQMLKGFKKQPLVEWQLALPDNDIINYNQLGASIMASQTHIFKYTPDFGQNFIHSSKRRYLKKLLKAMDNGDILLKEGPQCIEDLLWLQTETGKKSGFDASKKVLRKIMESLRDDQAYALVLYTPDGKALSGAYCPYDSFSAYHLVNASINHEDSLLNRSNILSTYLAIQKAMEQKLNFDFEGSNIPGVANYYRLMGGEPTLKYRIQIPFSLLGKTYFAAMRYK